MGEIADELIGRAMDGDFDDEFDGEDGYDSHRGRRSPQTGRANHSNKPGAATPNHNDDPSNPEHVRIGFGKHRGKRLAKIPDKYIVWLLGCQGLEPAFLGQVQLYAEKRGIGKTPPPSSPAGPVAQQPGGIGTSCKTRLSLPLPRGNQVDLWFRKPLLAEERAWLDRLFALANETVFDDPAGDVLGEPIRLPSVASPPSPSDEEKPPW